MVVSFLVLLGAAVGLVSCRMVSPPADGPPALVSYRFAVGHHSDDPLLRLRMHKQTDEGLSFERQDPGFVHRASRLDIATAHDLRDRFAEMEVVIGDEPS